MPISTRPNSGALPRHNHTIRITNQKQPLFVQSRAAHDGAGECAEQATVQGGNGLVALFGMVAQVQDCTFQYLILAQIRLQTVPALVGA
jgi:hypothetical protein